MGTGAYITAAAELVIPHNQVAETIDSPAGISAAVDDLHLSALDEIVCGGVIARLCRGIDFSGKSSSPLGRIPPGCRPVLCCAVQDGNLLVDGYFLFAEAQLLNYWSLESMVAYQAKTWMNELTRGGPLDSTNVLVYSIYREFYFNGKYGFAAAQSVMLFFIMLILTIIQFTVVEKRVNYE